MKGLFTIRQEGADYRDPRAEAWFVFRHYAANGAALGLVESTAASGVGAALQSLVLEGYRHVDADELRAIQALTAKRKRERELAVGAERVRTRQRGGAS